MPSLTAIRHVIEEANLDPTLKDALVALVKKVRDLESEVERLKRE